MRAVIILIAVMGGSAHATEMPSPRQYWCSLERIENAIGGFKSFDDSPFEANRRPTLLVFPHVDQSSITFSTINDAGTVYAYTRLAGEGVVQHMIHGVFEFETARLITSRSNLLPTNDGAWLPQSVSFISVCTEATN